MWKYLLINILLSSRSRNIRWLAFEEIHREKGYIEVKEIQIMDIDEACKVTLFQPLLSNQSINWIPNKSTLLCVALPNHFLRMHLILPWFWQCNQSLLPNVESMELKPHYWYEHLVINQQHLCLGNVIFPDPNFYRWLSCYVQLPSLKHLNWQRNCRWYHEQIF